MTRIRECAATLVALALIGLICLSQHRAVHTALAVIAVVAVSAVAAGAAAAVAVVAFRWARHLRSRGNPAPAPEDDDPAPLDWDAAFARVDEENRR